MNEELEKPGVENESNQAIARTQEEIAIRRLQREAKLEAIEHYLGFIVTKAAGGTLLLTGLAEFLWPDLIPAVLAQPLAVAGLGFTLLVGKRGARQLLQAIEQFIK